MAQDLDMNSISFFNQNEKFNVGGVICTALFQQGGMTVTEMSLYLNHKPIVIERTLKSLLQKNIVVVSMGKYLLVERSQARICLGAIVTHTRLTCVRYGWRGVVVDSPASDLIDVEWEASHQRRTTVLLGNRISLIASPERFIRSDLRLLDYEECNKFKSLPKVA